MNQLEIILQKVDITTYMNLKRNCIARGMPFIDVMNGDYPRLNSWLHKNIENKADVKLLEQYDIFIDGQITDPELKHPTLRTAYIGERAEEQKLKTPKPKIKVDKKPKEKDENGIIKGTKKSYVIDLVKKGKSLDRIITKTIRKFPDAKEKSIKIWVRKQLREMGEA